MTWEFICLPLCKSDAASLLLPLETVQYPIESWQVSWPKSPSSRRYGISHMSFQHWDLHKPKRISNDPISAVRPRVGELFNKSGGELGRFEGLSIALGHYPLELLLVGQLRILERIVGDPNHPYLYVRAVPHTTCISNLVFPPRQVLSTYHSTTKRTSKLVRLTGFAPRSPFWNWWANPNNLHLATIVSQGYEKQYILNPSSAPLTPHAPKVINKSVDPYSLI